MIKKLAGENWKTLRKKYAVSSHGRVASFTDDIHEDGKLLNGSLTTGYKSLNLHRPNSKGTIYIHREVAKLFSKKPSPKHKFVVHVNHNKLDNRAANLKWATQEEVAKHQQKSPAKIAYKKIQASRNTGLKLNAKQVSSIKKILGDPKRKLTFRQLAEKYSVSEMTLYRIKSGENWSKVK
jgi:NUMOD4 motif/HNH endonuclease